MTYRPAAGFAAGKNSIEESVNISIFLLNSIIIIPGLGAADEVVGTGALGAVVQRPAVGALAARVLVADGGAAELLALLVGGAVVVALALIAAALERVPHKVGLAAADRPVVLSHLAIGIGTARGADLVPRESAAGLERVSGEPPGAPADGHVPPHVAVRARPAGRRAGVNAVVVLAGLVFAAVAVGDAVAAVALLEGVAHGARLAPADGSAALVLADGVPAAGVGHGAGVGAAPDAAAVVGASHQSGHDIWNQVA